MQDVEVLHKFHPIHASPGRGDIVAATERRFTADILEEIDKRTAQGKQLVGVSDHNGNLRLFFARPL